MGSDELNNAQETAKSTFNLKKEVFEWFYTIIIALLIAFLIKAFLFDLVVVDGRSMVPTLHNGDRLIVTKLGYSPKQQDIIVLDSAYKRRQGYYESFGDLNTAQKFVQYFKAPKSMKRKYYVKRVIAMPGQTVDIIDNKVYVDNEPLDEYYYSGDTAAYDSAVSFPFTVSDDCVFVMGDNRPESKDSRSSELGEVPIKAILGKCQLRILPVSGFGKVD